MTLTRSDMPKGRHTSARNPRLTRATEIVPDNCFGPQAGASNMAPIDKFELVFRNTDLMEICLEPVVTTEFIISLHV